MTPEPSLHEPCAVAYVAAEPAGGGICTYGDTVIDVIVELTRDLVPDGDVPATISVSGGGQAANVAAWSAALGWPASVVTRLGHDAGGDLLRGLLRDLGVTVHVPPSAVTATTGPATTAVTTTTGTATTGTVVSLSSAEGSRTMASYRGRSDDVTAADLRAEWFAGKSWLHLSGYVLFGSGDIEGALAASRLARTTGGKVSVDVSAASLLESLPSGEVRRRLAAVGASVVFANAAEARTLGDVDVEVLVIKRGDAGCSIRTPGGEVEWPAVPGTTVRDTTGAGDAFAAGWLVGGHHLAAVAAAACVETVGAFPPPGWRPPLGTQID